MKIIMLLIMFLLIGALFIIYQNNLPLIYSENREKLVGLYFSWIGDLFDNSVSIIGNVVKMNWLPKYSERPKSFPI
ncbi:hypothetical protein HYW76_05630 [Candidatus Pacearchaeota archaeon]|nr:hypothetical protein [Candidatus Pacearchaeota archaeon]